MASLWTTETIRKQCDDDQYTGCWWVYRLVHWKQSLFVVRYQTLMPRSISCGTVLLYGTVISLSFQWNDLLELWFFGSGSEFLALRTPPPFLATRHQSPLSTMSSPPRETVPAGTCCGGGACWTALTGTRGSSTYLSSERRRAFMKKFATVDTLSPSCSAIVACMSLLGRRVSLKMASSVRRWMSVKTSRGFLWTTLSCPLTGDVSARPRWWCCCSDGGSSWSRSLHATTTTTTQFRPSPTNNQSTWHSRTRVNAPPVSR